MDTQKTIDRRGAKRWDVSLKALYKDSNMQDRQALVNNISNKGLRLFLCSGLTLDTEVDLQINLQKWGFVFAKAKACWKKENPDGTYAGFRFTQIKESERDKVFEYITHVYRQQVKNAWFS